MCTRSFTRRAHLREHSKTHQEVVNAIIKANIEKTSPNSSPNKTNTCNTDKAILNPQNSTSQTVVATYEKDNISKSEISALIHQQDSSDPSNNVSNQAVMQSSSFNKTANYANNTSNNNNQQSHLTDAKLLDKQEKKSIGDINKESFMDNYKSQATFTTDQTVSDSVSHAVATTTTTISKNNNGSIILFTGASLPSLTSSPNCNPQQTIPSTDQTHSQLSTLATSSSSSTNLQKQDTTITHYQQDNTQRNPQQKLSTPTNNNTSTSFQTFILLYSCPACEAYFFKEEEIKTHKCCANTSSIGVKNNMVDNGNRQQQQTMQPLLVPVDHKVNPVPTSDNNRINIATSPATTTTSSIKSINAAFVNPTDMCKMEIEAENTSI